MRPLATLRSVALLAAVLAGAPALAAQEAPDPKALETARQLLSRRTPLADVAAELQRSHRQSASQTTVVFATLRVAPAEVGPAVMRVYRLGGDATLPAMVAAGFRPDEATAGLARAGVAAGELARGLRSARVPARDAAAALRGAGVGMRETVAGFRVAGFEAREAAAATTEVFRTAPAELSPAFKEAGYPLTAVWLLMTAAGAQAAEVAAAARADGIGWEEAASFLEDQYALDGEALAEALLDAGYAFPAPGPLHYRIADFRRGGTGTIENLGVVDPKLVGSGNLPGDGTVIIGGAALDLPGTRVRMVYDGGSAEGEILAATGGEGDSELEVRLVDFRSGTLEVVTPGGVTGMPALALSHRTLGAAEVFQPEPILSLGGGGGTVVWGFTGATTAISVPSGGVANVDPVAAGLFQDPVLTVAGGSGHELEVRATFTLTPQIAGSWTPTLTWWTCGSFEIEASSCSSFDAACIASQLGTAAASLLTCANPDNWEQETRDGAPLPLAAVGAGQVTFAAWVDVIAGGQLLSVPAPPEFACAVAPVDPASAVAVGSTQAWVATTLGPAVMAANGGFHQAVLGRLADWESLLPGLAATGARLRGVYGTPAGALLLEFEH